LVHSAEDVGRFIRFSSAMSLNFLYESTEVRKINTSRSELAILDSEEVPTL